MDEKYVGLEGCEDLWELLRSVHQNQGLLEGWHQHFRETAPTNSQVMSTCWDAIETSKKLFSCIVDIYSEVFVSLQ